MLRFAADENLDARIVAGLSRRLPELDVLRVQEAGLSGAPDPAVLEWAADEERTLLTHDVRTMPRFATDRLRAEKAMPGLVVIPDRLSIGEAVKQLELLAQASTSAELDSQILYLPF